MGSTTVQAPTPVSPAQIGSDSLAAQLQLAPQVFAANQQYLPQYADLATQVAGQQLPTLLDQQATANTAQRTSDINDVRNLAPQALDAWRAANPELQSSMGALSSAIMANGATAAPTVGSYTAATPTMGSATMAAAPTVGAATYAATPSVGTAAQAMDPTLGNAARSRAMISRTSGLYNQLSGDASANLGKLSPIQQQLQAQAMQQLSGDLTPAQIAQVQQDTRGAYAARGLYDSNQAIGAEILNTDAARNQRLAQAQQLAGQVDAAGQAQTAANRGYATDVSNQGQQNQQFNANLITSNDQANTAAQNQYGLSRYGTQASLGTFNAGQANAFSQLQAQLGAQANQSNADASNTLTALQAQLQGQTNLANAGAANNNALASYTTQAGLNQFNAGQLSSADLTNAQLSQTHQQQNISNLFNLAQSYAGQSQDPYSLVLGRSTAPQSAQGVASSAGPTMFDPFNSSITNIYAGNQANQLAANTATANNNGAKVGAGIGAAGAIAGAALIVF